MQLSYQTIGFHDASLEDAIRTIAEAGFDAVHLAPWRMFHLHEAHTNGVRRVREIAEAAEVAIQAVGVHTDPVAGPGFADDFDLAVAVAKDCGVDTLSLQPGSLGELDRAAAMERMAENLKPCLDRAAADCLRVTIEPVNQYGDMFVVRGLDEFLKVSAAAGRPEHLGMHCDVMWLMDGRFIDELVYDRPVDDLLGFLKHTDCIVDVAVHWLDDIVPFGLSGWQEVYSANDGPKGPWWTESYDSAHRQWVNEIGVTFQDVIRSLKEIGFDRPLVMEYENVYARSLEDAAIAARRICNQARAMVQEVTG
ncbi:MAG: sugar phosphate isomerase/epimerase family protein [Planctomycetota bacterium]|jgi:sugar phosphate isomerase/epimerase